MGVNDELTNLERGMILLCCDLGDPDAAPLTTAQFRELSRRVLAADACIEPGRHLTERDLLDLDYDRDFAARVVTLLDRQPLLGRFLTGCKMRKIHVFTRISDAYPKRLAALRQKAPPVVLMAGAPSLMEEETISLTGSRDLNDAGALFARRVGRITAGEDKVLVTGGAVGADHAALLACLQQGGRAVIFPARPLNELYQQYKLFLDAGQVLLCAEGSADAPFSAARASSRNQLIYRTADRAFVAQAAYRTGGTWSGALENLRRGWTPLYVNQDGGEGCRELVKKGAVPIDADHLQNYICRQVIWDEDP